MGQGDGGVAPPDYLNIAWDDEARRFAQGEAAMTFTWFGRESFFSDPTKSKIVGKYGEAPGRRLRA